MLKAEDRAFHAYSRLAPKFDQADLLRVLFRKRSVVILF